MTVTHFRARRAALRPDLVHRGAALRLAALRAAVPTTTAARVTTPCPTQLMFVFESGRPLSPTEVATLRLLTALGTRPVCVVAGTDRELDDAAVRAGLRPRASERSAGLETTP